MGFYINYFMASSLICIEIILEKCTFTHIHNSVMMVIALVALKYLDKNVLSHKRNKTKKSNALFHRADRLCLLNGNSVSFIILSS